MVALMTSLLKYNFPDDFADFFECIVEQQIDEESKAKEVID